MRRIAGLGLLALLAACGAPRDAGPVADGSIARSAFAGAFAMPDRFSAEVTEDVLARGGHAVDAAVAAAFVLAVTLPEAGNIGGGGFMLVRAEGGSHFLDYRETAPAAAGRDLYLDEDGNVEEDTSLIGHRAVGVPGTVAGLWEAHQRFGTQTWAELLEPAVRLAEDGFAVPDQLAEEIAEATATFRGRTNFADYFGDVQPGATLRQAELAQTLRRIQQYGVEDFYRGATARLLVDEMGAHGGLITAADLERYRAVWREPLAARWREFQVVSAPPPSSGGFGVIQLLNMKAHLDEAFAGVPLNGARYVHLVAEMQKRVFADRAEYLGDADFVDVPIQALIDDDYIRRRANEVNPRAISPLTAVRPGLAEGRHTTHFSIVDAAGNAVANTYTLNTSFGSGVVVPGGGFLLNNEMDDFSAKPGVPNFYGVVGNEANAIEPGKRPLSSMSPTLLLDDNGQVRMAIGTPGGSTIFGSVFQAIAAVVDFELPLREAVAQPRFHHQLLPPDLITYTPSVPLDASVIAELAQMGYRVEPHGWEFGDLQAVWFDGSAWQAAADPRHRGEARVLVRPPVREAASASRWPAAWLAPTEPFHIVDGIYYVGSEGLGAFLVTTADGHVLIDGGLPETAAQIEASIARLGYDLADVRILLNSHAHFDHSGGLAELKAKSGARLYAHAGDVSALEGGFYLGSEEVEAWRTPPVAVDRVLEDGAVVELGGRQLVLHHTPGHSRGCSSWGLTAQVETGALNVLVFCSATVAANRLVGPPQYEGIVDDYRATFAWAKAVNVDVPLAPHPEFFGLLEKRERAAREGSHEPFVDAGAFAALLTRLEADFEARLLEATAAIPSAASR